MRKQYHIRRVGSQTHLWDVHRLIRLSRDLPVVTLPLSAIAELDEDWWYAESTDRPTPRALAAHLVQVRACDLRFPVILCAEGRLMDGMHRLVRCLAEGLATVSAVRFPVTPAPDFVNVSLNDLPYPDEEI